MSKKKVSLDPAVTRYPSPIKALQLSKEDRIAGVAKHMEKVLEFIGMDIEDPSIKKTPLRIAKMYIEEVFSGIDPKQFPKTSLIDEEHVSEVGHQSIVLTKCSFTSFCEHHFVPMVGSVFVAYIPSGQLIGLSKIHRIVRYFASRPQLQERLTSQIADSLSLLLQSEHVAVSIYAEHFCVKARGIRDDSGMTSTSYFSGDFKADSLKREEFFRGVDRLSAIGGSN